MARRDGLPKMPVLSVVRFKFRPEADFMDEQHVAHTLWQKSLAFTSTVSGFQRLLWAPISDEPRGVVLLIQWRDGTAWQEFQLSFGLGLLLPLLQDVPPLNQSVTLSLPPRFASGPGHFLELVELSVKLAENEYDPAERSRWIEEEWQAVVESLGTAPSESGFPGLICGSGGWFEDQLPLESRTFLGLLLWRTPRDAITWTPHQTVRHKLQALIGHTIRQSSLVTASIHDCGSSSMSLAARSSASLASYSGTIFQTQISPPQYTPDKDFEYQTRFDVRARRSIDDVASRRRICPSPEAIWCPMGAMGQVGFPTFQDVPSPAAAPTVDVLWLQLNEQRPETLSLLRNLRLAIYNSIEPYLSLSLDQHSHVADHIVMLNSNGRIEKQGSVRSFGLISQPITHASEASSEIPTAEDESQDKSASRKKVETLTVDDIADIARRTGDVAVYTYYMKAIGWPSILGACLIIVVHTFSSTFPRKVWLKLFTNDDGQNAAQFIGIYVLLAVVASGTQGLMIRQIMIKIVIKSGLELHRVLVRTVVDAPMHSFAGVDSGVILNRFSQDMTLVDAVLPTMAFGTVLSVAQCFAQAALISLGSSYMAVTIVPCLLVLYCAQKVYLRTSRQLRFLDLEARSPLYTLFVETFEGLSTIRGLGWQRSFVAECLRRLDDSQKPYYLLYCIQRWLNVVLDLLVAALAVILIALATSLRESTDPGKLGVSLTAIMAFSQTLQEVVSSWTSLETSLGAIARTRSFEMKMPSEHDARERVIPPPGRPADGRIEIDSISASYDGTTRAFDNVSLSIGGGEKVMICGRTGSGKSTLVSALLRLLDPLSGTISIDGIDISTVPRNELRSRVIAIPQDPFLLPGDIRFNLDPTGRAADSTLLSALERCSLLAVVTSRGGLDEELTSASLSQGEGRLFALAVALVRKWNRERDSVGSGGGGGGGILILDEATSGTDAATHALIQQVVDQEFREYTVLQISHRPDEVRSVDRVVKMQNGRVLRG